MKVSLPKKEVKLNTNTKHKEELSANRNYKDTIFRWLFSDRENLLSLYNAISGKHYEDPEALMIVTLKNAVYMGMKNDIAFVLETGLYLYEHQSTHNPNIPLRDLFYIASEYQAMVDQKSLYSSAVQKIPTPKFLVFYNGTDKAIAECIQEGILSEFLQQNRKEVYKVSIFEYDKEKEEKKLRKAEYEHGLEDGIHAFILDKQEDGIAPEIILAKLQRAFSLTQEEAQRYLDTVIH